jgi:hypothetical protein
MQRRSIAIAIALLCAALLAVPTGASAQAGGSRFPTVLLSAKTSAGGFKGSFVIRRFRVRGAGIAAFGRLNGTLRDRRYPTRQRVHNRTFSFDVAAAQIPGARTCARLAINMAARVAPVVGLPAAFAARTLVLRPRGGTGPSTGELLCGASTAVAVNAPPAVTVHLLNALRLQYA